MLLPFLAVSKGLRARDDVQLQKPPICSSKELLSLHFLPPCCATTIETHVVAVATAVAMALGMAVAMTLAVAVAVALDTSLALTLTLALALALPAVDAGHFSYRRCYSSCC